MRVILALGAYAAAAVLLSACASTGTIKHAATGESLVFVANGPSTALGVDNTDIYSATPGGRTRDVTSSATAESEAAWSADGRYVVFVRSTPAGDGSVRAGVFVWSPDDSEPRQVAACSSSCDMGSFVWSPDDRRIAFTTGWFSKDGMVDSAVKVMNADGSDVHVACASECGEGLASVGWSPDSRRLVFSNEEYSGALAEPAESDIWVANADGSGAHKLTHPGGCTRDVSPTWAPNGSRVAFSRELCSWKRNIGGDVGEVMRADGSHLHAIAHCACSEPAWSADGRTIAWVHDGPRGWEWDIRLTTLSGRTSTLRTCSDQACVSPPGLAWSPNDRQLAFFVGRWSTGEIWTIRRNGSGLRRVSREASSCCLAWVTRSHLPGRVTPAPRHMEKPHFSGTIAYDTTLPGHDDRSRLEFLSLATGRLTRMPWSTSAIDQPTWSPDGSRLAFMRDSAGNRTDLWIVNRDGSNLRQVTHVGEYGEAKYLAWSPDGRDIAFVTGGGGIELIRPDGTEPIRTILTPDGNVPQSLSWSPDGRELVFDWQNKDKEYGPTAIYSIGRDGSRLKLLANLSGYQANAAWSPDGREIAFDWSTDAGDSLYLIRPDGTHLRRVTTSTVPWGRPAWSPDGRYLLLLSGSEDQLSSGLVAVDVKTGRVSTLIRKIPLAWSNPAWSSR